MPPIPAQHILPPAFEQPKINFHNPETLFPEIGKGTVCLIPQLNDTNQTEKGADELQSALSLVVDSELAPIPQFAAPTDAPQLPLKRQFCKRMLRLLQMK